VLSACAGQAGSAPRALDGDQLSLVWTYDSGAPINHTPLAVSDLVLFVPSGGSLTALEATTGAMRWQYAPPQGVWERSYTTDGRQVFVGVGGGTLAALDAASGSLRWQRDLGIEVQRPPLVQDGVLFVPTTFVGPGIENNHDGRAKLFALQADDGTPIWTLETENYILQTPAIHNGSLYAAGDYYARQSVEEGGHMRMYAIDAADGAIRWTYESEDGFPKRLHANESVVAFVGYQDFVSGVSVSNGALLWRRDTGNWVPSLTGTDDTIYFGSANTIVHALNLSDGQIRWQHNIEEGTFNYALGAPALIEGELYFLTQHGDIMALDAATGDLLWQIPTDVVSRVGLSVGVGWLFVGDQLGTIYAYSDH
jgi:outer membrane protein assembly factor BamB